jgi:hypothetical protein
MSAGIVAFGKFADLEAAFSEREEEGVFDVLVSVFGFAFVVELRRALEGQFEAGFGYVARVHGFCTPG